MNHTDITFPKGFTAFGLACQIKKNGKPDLGLLISHPPAQIFGALTRNAVKAAPVLYCQKVLDSGKPVSHILVNSGNANACTGDRGYQDVLNEVELLRKFANPQGEIMVSSTGVIGEYLPMEKIQAGIEKLAREAFRLEAAEGKSEGNLPGQDFHPFINSIMTTDTFEKHTQIVVELDGHEVRIGGIAKGAGMIRPNMATMLSYITTDIHLPANFRADFMQIVEKSFNSISVDGDMSTNDTVLLLANGASGISYSNISEQAKRIFAQGVEAVMQDLAKQIIRDGEGATKLITIEVTSAQNAQDAKAICRAIANSPLVKTAFFGGDANWGRVLAAAGSCDAELIPEKLRLEFCGVKVLEKGGAAKFDEADLTARMKEKDVSVKLDLGLGKAEWKYWTCDLSYEYVKINADYRS